MSKICCNFVIENVNSLKKMARPIKETPILFGDDARRFEQRMKNPPRENAEDKKLREANYLAAMSMFVK